MTDLAVVTFKWRGPDTYHSAFNAKHVNTLLAMLRRHYAKPFRFFCVTDDATGLAPGVNVVPLWNDHANVPNPSGRNKPSCYRRLKLFSRQAGEIFGDRIISIDLDMVVTADLAPLFDRPENFVIWGDTHPRTFYNGSFWSLKAGAHPELWEEFDPKSTPAATRAAGFLGSDQAWISYRLGPHMPTFGQADGVYSYRVHLMPAGGALPDNARLVVFHGKHDPWGAMPQRLAWVRQHWRE